MTERSNIAGAINAAHAGVEAAKKEGARYAIEPGRLLIQARDTVQHGRWDAWLKANCTMSPRTAQLYMKVARHVGSDPAKAQRVADMSLRELAREVVQPRARPVDAQTRSQTNEILKSWGEASPSARRRFAKWLYDDGQITERFYDALMSAADLTKAQATENVAAMMLQHLPADDLDRVIRATREAGATDLAKAIKTAITGLSV